MRMTSKSPVSVYNRVRRIVPAVRKKFVEIGY